jgi:hypothetical protein
LKNYYCLYEETVTADTVCKRKHSIMIDNQMDTDDSGHHGDAVCYPSTSTSQDLNIPEGMLLLATTYKRAYITHTDSIGSSSYSLLTSQDLNITRGIY